MFYKKTSSVLLLTEQEFYWQRVQSVVCVLKKTAEKLIIEITDPNAKATRKTHKTQTNNACLYKRMLKRSVSLIELQPGPGCFYF